MTTETIITAASTNYAFEQGLIEPTPAPEPPVVAEHADRLVALDQADQWLALAAEDRSHAEYDRSRARAARERGDESAAQGWDTTARAWDSQAEQKEQDARAELAAAGDLAPAPEPRDQAERLRENVTKIHVYAPFKGQTPDREQAFWALALPFGSLKNLASDLFEAIEAYLDAPHGSKGQPAGRVVDILASTECEEQTTAEFRSFGVVLTTPTSGTNIEVTSNYLQANYGPKGSTSRATETLEALEQAGIRPAVTFARDDAAA